MLMDVRTVCSHRDASHRTLTEDSFLHPPLNKLCIFKTLHATMGGMHAARIDMIRLLLSIMPLAPQRTAASTPRLYIPHHFTQCACVSHKFPILFAYSQAPAVPTFSRIDSPRSVHNPKYKRCRERRLRQS